ncbi:MAG: type II toxin-antitoxin system PemK/MazF family toxin [Kineosporiaceae bacterium]
MLSILGQALKAGLASAVRSSSSPTRSSTGSGTRRRRTGGTTTSRPRPSAVGSRRRPGTAASPSRGGVPEIEYRPDLDGRPDPGEIVWTWVPYEEDASQGKDRPVLLVARQGRDLLGLMLTSKDHDRDAADEARHGRVWLDLGSGAWDRQGRPSEVRLDRVLRIDPADVRREGAVLDRRRFDEVAVEVRRLHGWN